MNRLSLEEIRAEFTDADKLLQVAEKNLAYLQEFVENFEKTNAAIHQLQDFYYHPDFVEKLNFLREKDPEENFASSGEDSIWNLDAEFNSLKLQLLKKLADELNQNA